MTMAISKAVEEGAQAVICASTGNTSASAAAYAARAGPDLRRPGADRQDRDGQAGPGAGARRPAAAGRGQLRRLPGAGQQAGDRLPGEPGQQRQPVPHRGPEDGVVRDRRRRSATPPTSTACRSATPATSPPTGRATASTPPTALATRTPRMWGFQAAGAAPIVTGRVVENPSTIATAIRIGNPASWTKALAARDESGGRIDAVTDRAILAAYRLLARSEARLRRAGLGGVAWPACCRSRRPVSWSPGSAWSAPSRATGSRTRTGPSRARRPRSPSRSTPPWPPRSSAS